MKILMVEDERMVARGIKRMVASILDDQKPDIHHVPSLEQAQGFLAENQIDLLLLDLNLSGDDGFDLLAGLASQSFQTIVVSANTDRALQSYEYGVLDFVPKPVGRERLKKALRKLDYTDDTDGSLQTGRGTTEYLSIKAPGMIKILQVSEVHYIEAAGKYSEIHTADDHSHLHEKSLTALLLLLPKNFQRVHKSVIANLDFAGKLLSHEGSRYELQLKSDRSLRVGRAFVNSLRDRLS